MKKIEIFAICIHVSREKTKTKTKKTKKKQKKTKKTKNQKNPEEEKRKPNNFIFRKLIKVFSVFSQSE